MSAGAYEDSGQMPGGATMDRQKGKEPEDQGPLPQLFPRGWGPGWAEGTGGGKRDHHQDE